jgi:hypothetical protein
LPLASAAPPERGKEEGGVGEEEARQGADARHRRRVVAEAGRVREEPDEGEAPFVFEGEPDRSTPWPPTTRRHSCHDCYAYIADPW